jgi:hypothetical protein
MRWIIENARDTEVTRSSGTYWGRKEREGEGHAERIGGGI